MESIRISLFNSHKQVPVRKYILDDKTDFSDMNSVKNTIENFLIDRVWIQTGFGCGVNQADETMVTTYSGSHELVVYVRECPVQAVVALVALCAKNGVSLTIMHYNENTKDWDGQEVFN